MFKHGDKVRYTGTVNSIIYIKRDREYTVDGIINGSSRVCLHLAEISKPHAYSSSDFVYARLTNAERVRKRRKQLCLSMETK